MRTFDVSFALQVRAKSIGDAATEFAARFSAGQDHGWFFSVVDMETGHRYVYDTKIGAVIVQEPAIPTSEEAERIARQEEELAAMLAQIKSLRQNVNTLRQTVSNLEYLYDKARGIDREP